MAVKISSKSPKKFKTDCRWASSLTPRLRLGTPQPRFATSEERNDVNYRQPEPTLEDILSDSIIEAVMKADGVDPHQLAAMLKELGRRWAEELPSVAQGRHNPTPGRCEHATPVPLLHLEIHFDGDIRWPAIDLIGSFFSLPGPLPASCYWL